MKSSPKMHPKKNQDRPKTGKKNPKKSKEPIADAMAGCVLPEDIMLCILTRLPVKSLLRFKCVCMPWYKLFATPKFIKMHHDQFSSDPKNQNFIMYSLVDYSHQIMSLYSIEKKPTYLSFPSLCYPGRFVGCYNGLLCIGLPLGQAFALWNPAMRSSKFVQLPEVDFGQVSLDFGYDAEGDDFKVVRIVGLQQKNMGSRVEVYSVKSDSFRTIEVGFQFRAMCIKNDAIVNGNPYWVANVDQENESSAGEVLVWCDMTKLVLKRVPLPTLLLPTLKSPVAFVDWKGSLAAIVCAKNKDRVESIDVWVFDDGEMMWRKNHKFEPVEMEVKRCVQCLKNEKIIVECFDGMLFMFDFENGCVEEIETHQDREPIFVIYGYNESLVVYGYNESLVCIKGMAPMWWKGRKGNRGRRSRAGCSRRN